MKNLFFLFGFLFLIAACGPGKSALVKGVIVGKVQFVQDGYTRTLDRTDSKLELAPNMFSIMFPNNVYKPDGKFYAAQIAAFRDKKLLGNIKEGMAIKDISYFQSGTGLAGDNGQYEHMYLGDFQHHYIYFEEDGGAQRAQKVSEMPDGRYMLKWIVRSFYEDGVEIPFSMIGEEPIYVVVLIDANLNKVVDEDEYHTVQLSFN